MGFYSRAPVKTAVGCFAPLVLPKWLVLWYPAQVMLFKVAAVLLQPSTPPPTSPLSSHYSCRRWTPCRSGHQREVPWVIVSSMTQMMSVKPNRSALRTRPIGLQRTTVRSLANESCSCVQPSSGCLLLPLASNTARTNLLWSTPCTNLLWDIPPSELCKPVARV